MAPNNNFNLKKTKNRTVNPHGKNTTEWEGN